MTATDVTLAEARAAEARRRLDGTVERLQAELEPRRLARVALAEVTDGGERVARAGAEAARRNPGALAGAATLLVALIARKRIASVFKKKRHDTVPIPQDSAKPAERIAS